MDEKTKENAIKKMENMDQVVAYPDELLDLEIIDEYYKGLNVKDDHYENEILLSKFARYLEIEELRTKVDPKSWKEFAYPTIVNAFYHGGINTVIVTTGILQGV